MKNVHILPTDKPSRLCFRNYFFLNKDNITTYSNVEFKNIYITSDEEIKDGDWVLYHKNKISQVLGVNIDELKLDRGGVWKSSCKKIILTTDPRLIADGVQAIDDEFLEWFVKNPSCDFVEIERGYLGMWGFCKSSEIISKDKIHYKIIIPKEEPKTHPKVFSESGNELFFDKEGYLIKEEFKQETLEEAAITYSELLPFVDEIITDNSRLDFIAGAKWQAERMYSEEEVIIFLQKYRLDLSSNKTPNLGDTTKQWFKQHKKVQQL